MEARIKRTLVFCLIAPIVLCSATNVSAQTASMSGVVTDQSGGFLPRVTIKARHVLTNQTREVRTNEDGSYTIPNIKIGLYEITAELSGFKTEVRSGIELRVAEVARVDISLQVGDINERVNVNEEAPLVQSQTSSIGSVIDNKKIAELPLNGRSFQSLALLAPGAMEPAQGSDLGFRGGISVAGSREESTIFSLDGVDMMDGLVGNIAFKPSIDAIQEFRVQTSTFAADLGQMAGGQITVSTKSGTNDYHGILYDFLRNSRLDAKNFFDPPNQKIPQFQRNNFGFNIGGPILRDRTFFFFNAEYLRERRADTRTATVPLPAMLDGDFSSLTTAIRDPLTGIQFPGNKIPAGRINSAGQALAKLGYPAPNLPVLQRNFVSTPKDVRDIDQYIARVDHRLTDSNSFYVRYAYYDDFENDPFNVFGGISNLPFFGRLDTQKAHNLALVDTHVINPQLLLDSRFGFNRYSQSRFGTESESIPAKVGISGTSTTPIDFGWPAVRVAGYESLGTASFPTDRTDDTYQGVANLLYTRGDHSMKAGLNIEQFKSDRLNNSGAQGDFRFTGVYSGNGLADLLLGVPSQTIRRLGDTRNPIRQMYYAFYLQDDWKATPQLTLNLGLRYEVFTPFTSDLDRLTNYNPATGAIEIAGTANPVRDESRPENSDPDIRALLSTVRFVDLGHKNIYEGDYNNFAPRFGFAYDIFGNGRTVIRGGGGVFYDMTRLNYGISVSNNLPFRISQTFNAGPTPRLDIRNPFPVGLAASTLSPFAFQKNFKNAHIEQWNLSLQHQLLPDLVIDLTYAGSKSNGLWRDRNINQPFPGTTGSPNLRRPIPGFADIPVRESAAQAIYHSALVRVEKRFSQGLTFLASYTWSKSIDDSSGQATAGDGFFIINAQDNRNYRAQRAVSAFDATHRFVFSYVYELPFGKGRRWLNEGGIASWFLGGWELSGISTLMTGRPLTVRLVVDRSGTANFGNERPDLIGDPILPRGQRSPDRWFNTAAFALPALGTFGNAGRNIVRGPGINNHDVSFIKNNRFGEGRNLQFRMEIFNLPNHPNFDFPNRDFGTGQFGRIFSARAPRQIQFGLKLIY